VIFSNDPFVNELIANYIKFPLCEKLIVGAEYVSLPLQDILGEE
jgi:hypothetical protein